MSIPLGCCGQTTSVCLDLRGPAHKDGAEKDLPAQRDADPAVPAHSHPTQAAGDGDGDESWFLVNSLPCSPFLLTFLCEEGEESAVIAFNPVWTVCNITLTGASVLWSPAIVKDFFSLLLHATPPPLLHVS